MFGWKNPRIEDGEIGRNDGQEEEKNTDDLRDVKGVMTLEEVSEDNKAEDSRTYNDAGYGLRPGLAVAGKHQASPFFLPNRMRVADACLLR
jgi:hypothetical protein